MPDEPAVSIVVHPGLRNRWLHTERVQILERGDGTAVFRYVPAPARAAHVRVCDYCGAAFTTDAHLPACREREARIRRHLGCPEPPP